MKHCIHCEHDAEYSVCAIVSTLGRANRQQRCSSSLALCGACLQQICTPGGAQPFRILQGSLQAALEALTAQSRKEVT